MNQSHALQLPAQQFVLLPIDQLQSLLVEVIESTLNRKTEPPPPPTEPQELITAKELASHLNCSYQSVWNWKTKSKIPFLKIGRTIRFDKQKVLEVLNERR